MTKDILKDLLTARMELITLELQPLPELEDAPDITTNSTEALDKVDKLIKYLMELRSRILKRKELEDKISELEKSLFE